MTSFDTKKIISGVIACALVVGGVVALQSTGTLPQFLTEPGGAAAATAGAPTGSAKTKIVAASPAVAQGKININTASAEQLMTLRGIGPAKAAAIVAYRDTKSLFYRAEDIMKVSGIGPSMFESIKDNITVGGITPPATAVATSTAPAPAASIIVSAVMAGSKGNSADEYVELYNQSDAAVDLTGWSLKKISGAGATSTLVAAAHLSGKVIPPHYYFLLANAGYAGAVAPDVVWPSSYTFASTNNAVVLLGSSGQQVDTVRWSEIPAGESYARAALSSSDFALQAPAPHNSSR